MRAPARPLDVAQHEAAHLVVGVALGLRLSRATAARGGRPGWLGHTTFWVPARGRMAWLVTTAAGVAWERAHGDRGGDAGDLAILRAEGVRSARDVDALVVCAAALLESRGTAHARVTRALLEHDLAPRHIRALARGERLREE